MSLYSDALLCTSLFAGFYYCDMNEKTTEQLFPQVQKVTGHFFPHLNSKYCGLPYLNNNNKKKNVIPTPSEKTVSKGQNLEWEKQEETAKIYERDDGKARALSRIQPLYNPSADKSKSPSDPPSLLLFCCFCWEI